MWKKCLRGLDFLPALICFSHLNLPPASLPPNKLADRPNGWQDFLTPTKENQVESVIKVDCEILYFNLSEDNH